MKRVETQQTYFHIGYSRAASTFLQKVIFPALTGIQYIPRNRFRLREKEKQRFQHSKVLMSREAGLRIYERSDDAFKMFNSRMIISLRRHDHLLASNYRLHIKRGHSTRIQGYLDLDSDQGVWKQQQFEYKQLIDYVIETTGQKPIVLIFEDYIANPEKYLHVLCQALECNIDSDKLSDRPVHKSYTDKQLRLRRQYADRFSGNEFNQHSPGQQTKNLHPVFAFLHRRVYLWASALFMKIANFLPDTWLSDEPLIDKNYLERVKQHYQADWQACRDYVTEQNKALGITDEE